MPYFFTVIFTFFFILPLNRVGPGIELQSY